MSFATRHSLKCASTTSSNDEAKTIVTTSELESILPPLYLAEGLMAVEKPIDWTSQDVVSYVRGILERDARERGAKVTPIRRRSNKGKMKIKVGHGGSLDPLATGVLVLGVGRGTKELQQFLSGGKKYRAGAKVGFETTTLDMEGNITKTGPIEGITASTIESVMPKFEGRIMQVPPIFSALKRNGKRMYAAAREGKTAEDLKIEAREVEIYSISFNPVNDNGETYPCFGVDVECGGGTYIRSLIRDIGYEVNSCATMTSLVRTQQSQFSLEDALKKDDWNASNIYLAINKSNNLLLNNTVQEKDIK